MNEKPIIEPQNLGLWAAGAFIVALVALVVGFAGIQRANTIMVGTQAEIVTLNDKIEALKKQMQGAPAAKASSAPAEAAAPAETGAPAK